MNQVVSTPRTLPLIQIALVFGLLALLVYQPFVNAVKIWIGNEIYNHCLIVIPASAYLIWEKRVLFSSVQWKTSWLALPVLLSQLLLYTLGTAADIQLFQHTALFAMVPTLIWFFIGDHLAWQLKFPLCFIIFSIPVGEELVPFLQEITADMSVVMLQWTGIPLFRSGLFIEIPKGKFLVAEACSGVSFLIASIVLGNLYAYMNLVSMKYRVFFVLLSVTFPIFANAIRVWGIIYIAHLTDMEHAAGADHLIYGWFFFAFVLVCLFFIGEIVKRQERKRNSATKSTSKLVEVARRETLIATPDKSAKKFAPWVLVILIGLALFQDYRMVNATLSDATKNIPQLDFEETSTVAKVPWVPIFDNADKNVLKRYKGTNEIAFDVFYALYSESEGEVISSLNRLYRQENWTLSSRDTVVVSRQEINKEIVASSIGTRKIIYYWYFVDNKIVRSHHHVKLLQAFEKLKGKRSATGIVAISVNAESASQVAKVHKKFESNLASVFTGIID